MASGSPHRLITTIQAGSISPQHKKPKEHTMNTVSLLTNLVLADRFEAQDDGKQDTNKKESTNPGTDVLRRKTGKQIMIQHNHLNS